MRVVSCLLACATSAFAVSPAQAGGDGLAADARDGHWAHIKGRIAYAAVAPGWRADPARFESTGLKVRGISVMGDVYFGAEPPAGQVRGGGFRATSGVIVGAQGQLWGTSAMASPNGSMSVDRRVFGHTPAAPGVLADLNADPATVPYVGIGYSSLASRSGWSFSADLGVVSLSPGKAVRFGRVFGGGQSLDDVVRDMRLTPVLQLGVSYAF